MQSAVSSRPPCKMADGSAIQCMPIVVRGMEFFDLSKMFWFVGAPTHLLVWMLAAGTIFQQHFFGRFLVGMAALSFLLLAFLPMGDWAMSRLEDQYRRGPWPAHVDGVLELGGGINPGVLAARGLPGAETGEGGMVASAELARRYPDARIVFSGGNPDRGCRKRVWRALSSRNSAFPRAICFMKTGPATPGKT